MRKSLWKRAATAIAIVGAAILTSLGGGTAFAKEPAALDIFRDCVIPEIQLQIPRDGIASLTRSERKYVPATVREGKHVYTNVAVHLKGGPGSHRPLNDHPAFTLNFDKFAPGQTFHGLKKVHLNNSVQDQSYMHEKISRELFEAAGVPVPRAGNIWVNFNDVELGMYVLLEGVNKQFLKRYFKDVTGNVYDGHAGSEVTMDRLPTNSGDNRADRSRLHDLGAAVRESDPEVRLQKLGQSLDIERFYSFVAMELILGHWDGYTMNRNNFRLYHDRDSDRIVFLPHGLDQTFGRRYTIFPQNPAPVGAVARAVFEIPETRKLYRERYAELATNVFLVESLTNRIQQVAASIEAKLVEKDPTAAAAHRQKTISFLRRISQRAAELQIQLSPGAGTANQVKFNGIGVASLASGTNWFSKLDLGDARLDRETDSRGNQLLHISTDKGCTASWRTICELPPGQYRFQAHVKTKGVVLPSNDQRAGAGLRISGHRAGQKNAGDKEWAPVAFDFEVRENRSDTELVCELRAAQGEIWYDLSSLKLIRK